jgi:NADH dehydrogenase FAD-containing subunit
MATSAVMATVGSKGDRVVVLGSGWAGFNIALNANRDVPLTIISPNNHFLFTPLLPSTAVGTLEFRCIQEPIRTHLGPQGKFIHAKARKLDPQNKTVVCESVHGDIFTVEYDKLVIAVGVKTNTFGIPSIQEGNGIFFLKVLKHARGIRNNIIDSFEKAAVPTVSEAERRRLLSFVVVGGGPTSCEFTSELHGKHFFDTIRTSFRSCF